jgi:hypothetical protein
MALNASSTTGRTPTTVGCGQVEVTEGEGGGRLVVSCEDVDVSCCGRLAA